MPSRGISDRLQQAFRNERMEDIEQTHMLTCDSKCVVEAFEDLGTQII